MGFLNIPLASSLYSVHEVPRFIIVGFQTNEIGNQRQNSSIFNQAGDKNIYAMLIPQDTQRLTTIFHFLDSNLVELMVRLRYLGLSFST